MNTAPALALRTTTLIAGPFDKPLEPELVSSLAQFTAKAIGHGYAVLRTETDAAITVTAVQSAPVVAR